MFITGGTTDVSVYFQMRLTAGGDATGLTITDFDLTYTRTGDTPSAKADATDLGSANAAHSDNGGYEVDATDAPGLHRFDFPDAAFAAGVQEAMLTIKHASTFTETVICSIDAEMNVTKISGDAPAADNLEAQFDGTGYVDDTAPATQLQLGQIALTGAAVSTPANDAPSGFNITWGENEANDEDSTHAADATYHDIEAQNDGGTEKIDAYYEFSIGGDGIPTSVTWEGFLDKGGGVTKNITVQAFNWGTASWDQVGSIASGISNSSQTLAMFTSHVGTGANLGTVRIRFVTGSVAFTATTLLKTDQIFISYAIVARSVGYAGGAVWVDTNASNTNTENFVDGTADNPVSTWAAALTLSASLGIMRFQIINGSTIQLSANSDNYTMLGAAWNLQLNSQSIASMHVTGAFVTGIGTSAPPPDFNNCTFGAVTLPPCSLYTCGIGVSDGQFTGGSAGEYVLFQCYSIVGGNGTPDFDLSGLGASTGVNNRGWTGGSSWVLDTDCTVSHEVLAGGGQTFTGGGDVELRGIFREATVTLSASETVQIVGVAGLVAISGAATAATVNIDGVVRQVTDSSTGSTVNNNATNSVTVEMAQGLPPVTPTITEAIMYLYMAFRNDSESTTSERKLKNDAGTVIAKATMTEAANVFNQGKLATGP